MSKNRNGSGYKNGNKLYDINDILFLYVIIIYQIDKKLMQAAGMAGRVRQEVAIHSRLKHPAILELYTFFEDANYVYLVLELCHNGELQRYFKNHNKVRSF